VRDEQPLLVGNVRKVFVGVLRGGLFLRRRVLPLGSPFLAVLAALARFGIGGRVRFRGSGRRLILDSQCRIHGGHGSFRLVGDGQRWGWGFCVFQRFHIHGFDAVEHITQRSRLSSNGLAAAPAFGGGRFGRCLFLFLRLADLLWRRRVQHGGEGGFCAVLGGRLCGSLRPGLAAPAGLGGLGGFLCLGGQLRGGLLGSGGCLWLAPTFGRRWRGFAHGFRLSRSSGCFFYFFNRRCRCLSFGLAAPALGRGSFGLLGAGGDFGRPFVHVGRCFWLAAPPGFRGGGSLRNLGFSVGRFGSASVCEHRLSAFFRRGFGLAAPFGSGGGFRLGSGGSAAAAARFPGGGVRRSGGGGGPPTLGLLAGRGGRGLARRGPFGGHGEQRVGHGVLFPLFWHLCT